MYNLNTHQSIFIEFRGLGHEVTSELLTLFVPTSTSTIVGRKSQKSRPEK